MQPQYNNFALSASHTVSTPSRFNPGHCGSNPYRSLYFAENIVTALFEASALFGNALAPISNARAHYTIFSVDVSLRRVIDLTALGAQTMLDTDAQALTGDWRGYQERQLNDSVSAPAGIAPTQHLGAAIKADSRNIEGIISVSAKQPRCRILVLLTDNLSSSSSAHYTLTDIHGNRQTILIS